MNILIIEDESPAYRRLEKLIMDTDPSARIVGIVQSVAEGIEWFQANPMPELIFSDIQLSDDLSFTIYKKLNITIPIIFITAFDEYAINAFKFYSIDYLLKPVDADDLKKSLDKYKTIRRQTAPNNFDELLVKLAEKRYRDRFLVYFSDSLIPIDCNDVAYFCSENAASMLITHENKRYFLTEPLDSLENELNPNDFFRANRQYLVSSKAILKIHNFGNQKLKITIKPAIEEGIIISKLRATAFKRWLGR